MTERVYNKEQLFIITEDYAGYSRYFTPLEKTGEEAMDEIKSHMDNLMDERFCREESFNNTEFNFSIRTITQEEFDDICWED